MIEVIGVYIESKCIDRYIYQVSCLLKEEFDRLWNQYLMINQYRTNDLIIVDYYRSILIKMKFLINLPLALLFSYFIIFFKLCIGTNYFDFNTFKILKSFLFLA